MCVDTQKSYLSKSNNNKYHFGKSPSLREYFSKSLEVSDIKWNGKYK